MKKRILALVLILILATMSLAGCALFSGAKEYTVIFDSQGGSKVENLIAKEGSIIHAPEPPTRDGFEFGGWYRDKECTDENSYTFTTMPSGDITLYAKWLATAYTITLVGNGGTGSNIASYTSHGETLLPSDWVREGYRFAGWYESEDFSGNRMDKIAKGSSGNKTFYAKWVRLEPGMYLVTLYGNGGTGTGLDKYKEGEGAMLPTDWVRQGYTFNGWYESEDFSGIAVTEIDKTSKSDRNFYAKWTANEYTITFVTNSASTVPSITAPYESKITAPTVPTNGDLKFVGWFTDEALTNKYTFTTMPYGGITLYAKWVQGFTITYYSDGASVYTEDVELDIAYIINPIDYDFYKPNYYFDGWYTDSEFKNKVNNDVITVTENIDLYAKWTHRSFMSDYAKFSRVGTRSNPIIINSRQEMIKYFDYMMFDSKHDTFTFKMNYIANSSSAIGDEINKIVKQSTSYVVPSLGSYTITSSGVVEFPLRSDRKFEGFVKSPNQANGLIDKAYIGLGAVVSNIRSANFDEFKYKSYPYSIDVEYSDQLFYALQYGINPIPRVGSSAELMLNKAKTILRSIVSDDMTDTEKLYAIFSWFGRKVKYDHAVVNYMNQLNTDVYNLTNEYNSMSSFDSNRTAVKNQIDAKQQEIKMMTEKYDAWHIEGVFNNGVAVCDGISKAFTVLAGIEGISCLRITSEPIAGVVEGHAWNKVCVDIDGDGLKEWYNIDATWANTQVDYGGSVKEETFNGEHFMFRDSDEFKKPRIAENHLDIKAETYSEAFKYLTFNQGGNDYTFYIKNDAELLALAEYLYDQVNSGTRIKEYIAITVEYDKSVYANDDVFIGKFNNKISQANGKHLFGDNNLASVNKFQDDPGKPIKHQRLWLVTSVM